jgi:hypothetical protein
MPRTDADAVAAIIRINSNVSATPFIELANVLVTRHCTGDNGPETEYSEETLELIERWLSAHLYDVRIKQVASEKAGPVGRNFAGFKTELGLDNSQYGQMAKMLDDNGGLAAADMDAREGRKRGIGVTYLGTPPETEEQDY